MQNIKRVIVGTDTLQKNQYCFDLENGWVMLAAQPVTGTLVTIETAVSWDIDMGITNWDQSIGNYLFLNTTDPVYANSVENLPDDFVLYQNYPNPFNPSTKIKFSISQDVRGERQEVTIKVYDVLGNEIVTLVNDEKPAGEYEVEFSVGRDSSPVIASGIYFYQLRVGNFVQTKKMVLLK